MPIAFLLFTLLCVASFADAKEYGNYNLQNDLKRIIRVADTPSGKQTSIHLGYLDHILNDLSLHARNYPPQFDTREDRERAVEDVKTLSVLFDILVNGPSPNVELLLRAGLLNSIGHNLDIPGAAEKADSIFRSLLIMSPSDPRANYHFGTFLAAATKSREALPYLEKALAAGMGDAAYGLGMTYLALGDKHKALEHLDAYQSRRPNDAMLAKLIEDIRKGHFEIKRARMPEEAAR